ncbi:MAG TPA: flagellar biosynthesis protein FlhA [Myxococcales bacterium LLY-WYZ-16_1]|nr:flagellar biosynthesis protein FlhA [Myxococcales bacterium LLY-WYZ-16_1]
MNVERLAAMPRVMSPEIVVGAAFLGVVVLLMVPVPPPALDLLLALSIALSAMVFLTALFSERPTDFSIFPTLLLVSTLLRLSLNIASTRLILLRGHEGPDAAGQIILSFSQFVVGGNLGVGIIVFLTLVVINFVVITKGAGRIAEVAARFTLDAMPGKQMAIDAELNAGAINDSQARERRSEIETQANFYGAMDGASKFVRGDAVAGLIITGINLIGGLAIGMSQQSLTFNEALSSYSILTVGDGLVSQMPALVISTAAGLAISRASGRSEFGRQVAEQMLGTRNVLFVAAGFLTLLGLLPGLPMFPFLVMAGAMVFAATRKRPEPAEAEESSEEDEPEDEEAQLVEALRVDPLTLEVGYGLLNLVDAGRGGDLPDRVKKLRKQLAQELGLIVPPVRVVDNLQLESGKYAIKLHGTAIGQGELMPDRHLAIDSVGSQEVPGGIATKEPVFGLDAFWVPESERATAESMGLTVVDPATVLSTHLAEALRSHAHQLLGRDQVHELLGFVRQEAPKLVEELVPEKLSLGDLVEVLQLILRERVSIRNLRVILESVANAVGKTKDLRQLAEVARAAIGRQICASLADDSGLSVIVLDRNLELHLRNCLGPEGDLAPEPSVYQQLLGQTADIVKRATEGSQTPVLLVANELRRPLRELTEPHLPDVPVLALRELDRQVELRIVGTVSADVSN